MVYLEKAMKTANLKDYEIDKATVLYRLAYMTNLSNDHKKANELLFESLHKLQKHKASKKLIADNLFIIGSNLIKLNKKKESYKYYNKALNLYKFINNLSGISYSYSSLGSVLLKLKKYDVAEKYLDSAIDIQKKWKLFNYLENTYNRKTILYYKRHKLNKAITYANKSLEICKKQKNYKKLYSYYNNISYLYNSMGKYKIAYQNLLKAFQYKDTVLKNDYHKKMIEIETKYQTQQKKQKFLNYPMKI